ncbi:DUF445 domain-containing protein [Paenibacillus sp. FSL H7-0331]|uniref:DUF445 domain-containing protein n=1 Tax=Paenibacillus sp. FSL H7-0331 TaxID=1920421 RepID=UPI00096C1DCF|nr:DUF445 domain-containing protein [Paenibacillus sp. FSL H7-0331]OMF03907.1 hypothetical protein BK127_34815 [Paenibacillus sp. FSL H7-0331]
MGSNSRYTATVSLVVMAAGFIGTLFVEGPTWVRFLQSGFEAGLVGGLADWFAVTALFRHPLGIPIPHTALLPKNREKVSRALVNTIQEDLLSKQSITDKLAQIPLVSKILQGAAGQLSTNSAKTGVVTLSEYAIRQLPLEKLAALGEREVRHMIDALDLQDLLKQGLQQVYTRGYDEKVFDFALNTAEQLIMKPEIRDRMGAMASQALQNLNAGGMMQFALNAFAGFFNDEKLGGLIQQFMLNGLDGLRSVNNPNRKAVMRAIHSWLDNPGNQYKLAIEMDHWKAQLLDEWKLEEKLLEMLQRLQAQALEFVNREDYVEAYVIPVVNKLVNQVCDNEELLDRLESGLREQIARWIEANHHKIGTLIRENIDRFDDKTLITLMEDKIGGDLQWIRVNGAICGFLIGIILAGIKLFAG